MQNSVQELPRHFDELEKKSYVYDKTITRWGSVMTCHQFFRLQQKPLPPWRTVLKILILDFSKNLAVRFSSSTYLVLSVLLRVRIPRRRSSASSKLNLIWLGTNPSGFSNTAWLFSSFCNKFSLLLLILVVAQFRFSEDSE